MAFSNRDKASRACARAVHRTVGRLLRPPQQVVAGKSPARPALGLAPATRPALGESNRSDRGTPRKAGIRGHQQGPASHPARLPADRPETIMSRAAGHPAPVVLHFLTSSVVPRRSVRGPKHRASGRKTTVGWLCRRAFRTVRAGSPDPGWHAPQSARGPNCDRLRNDSVRFPRRSRQQTTQTRPYPRAWLCCPRPAPRPR